MKTLQAHGFSQRPRFEQVWAFWSGMSRCPPTFMTSHFYLDNFAQSSENPNPQHTP